MTSYLEASVDRSFNELLEEVATKNPVSVLYVEDNLQAATQVQDLFTGQPVLFYSAASADEADQVLLSYDIDVAVVDVRLGDGTTSGEEWIFRNREKLRSVEVIVLTANFGYLSDATGLRSIVKSIVVKGQPEQREVWEMPSEIARERAKDRLRGMVSLHGTMIQLFKKWAGSFEEDDGVSILLGARELSMQDLVTEVEKGSDLGLRYLKVFAEDLESEL